MTFYILVSKPKKPMKRLTLFKRTPMTTPNKRFIKRIYTPIFTRIFAFVLLFTLVSETLCAGLVTTAYYLAASGNGGGPVADMADGMVDLYTGDFRYSVPLLTVPGPNGESVPLSANYGGGVRMNQSASWIGLGWDLNPGEISRQVVGIPDDFAGQIVTNAEITTSTGFLNNIKTPGYGLVGYYGPFNHNKIKNATNAHVVPPPVLANNWNSVNIPRMTDNMSYTKNIWDIYNTGLFPNSYSQIYKLANQGGINFDQESFTNRFFNRRTAPIQLAAYDNYYVSGSGMNGTLKPYIMDGGVPLLSEANYYLGLGSYPEKKRTQFHFENSTKQTTYNTPGTYTNNATNYIPASVFVRYYTNAEINTAANLVNSTVPGSKGFIDYRVVAAGQSRRPVANYDPDGIGGIQITNANGLTYHYSLPVYNKKQLNKQIYQNFATNIYLKPSDPFQKMGINYIHDAYAVSWKLTAVTGTDYVDKNANKTVDEGDEGYWIQYAYSLWAPDFLEGSSYYNYGQTFRPNYTEAKTIVWSSYQKGYYTSNVETEKYYLDYIRTATHSAYFIKDTRMDNFSVEGSLNPGDLVSPELRLASIVLLRNSDKALIENNASWAPSSIHAKFKPQLFSTPQSAGLIHINKYLFNKASIDAAAISGIAFETSYSLAKGYYRNVYNSFNSVLYNANTKCVGNASTFFKNFNYGKPGIFNFLDPLNPGFTSTNMAQSGKLTLKAIRVLEEGNTELFDAYQFNYDEGNALKNPNFNPEKTDLWGFYKADANYGLSNSGYATPASALQVDAWSLKTIKIPSGGLIRINYEADVFEREGYSDKPVARSNVAPLVSGVNKHKPYLLFPIVDAKQASTNSFPYDIVYSYRDVADVDVAYGTGAGYGYANVTALKPLNVSPTGTTTVNRFIMVPFTGLCQYSSSSNIHLSYNYLEVSNLPSVYNTATSATVLPSHSVFNTSKYNFDRPQQNSPNNTLQLNDTWQAHPFTVGYASSFCQSNSSVYGYDQLLATGYTYICLNRMVGGGTRVKSVEISDPESGMSYKKEFSYEDGYCKAVPRPFVMAPYVGGRQDYQLWDNVEASIPYFNSTGVGYTKVTTKTSNTVPNTSLGIGKTVYEFNNYLIENPLQSKVRLYQAGSTSYAKCNSLYASHVQWGSETHGQCYKLTNGKTYYIESILNDANVKQLGLLVTEKRYSEDNVEVYAKENTYHSFHFFEVYSTRSLYLPIAPVSPNCFGNHGFNPLIYPEGETYVYESKRLGYYYYLKSVSEKVDNITTTQVYDYDAVTGFPIKVTATGPTMGTTVKETEYAYTLPAFSRLGFKYSNEDNTNELTVTSKVRLFKNTKLVSEERTDNLKSRLTRMREAPGTANNPYARYYTYFNDLAAANTTSTPLPVLLEAWATPLLADAPANGQSVVAPAVKTSGVVFFDKRGHVLEAEGVNGRKSATRYGYNMTLPLSSISNAGYNSFAFSSFEDLVTITPGVVHYGGEVSRGQTQSGPTTLAGFSGIVKPHSGNYMAKVVASNGPEVLLTQFDLNRTYEAKVWVHVGSAVSASLCVSLVGVSTTSVPVNVVVAVGKNNPSNVTVGNWVLMRAKLDVPANLFMPVNPKNGTMVSSNEPQLKVSLITGLGGEAYFDDLMVNPIDAPISGTVYDPKNLRVSATLNSENFGTYYNYDAAGRILNVFGESAQYGLKKLSEVEYTNCKSLQLALPINGGVGGTN